MIFGSVVYGPISNYLKKPFKNPRNLAQKIANYCVLESNEERNAFFDGGKSRGVSYEKKFIIDRTVYNVEVTSWDNRPNEMRIQSNFFNSDLGDERFSKEDMLLYGSLNLLSSNFYFDKNLDGAVDDGRIFTKPCAVEGKGFLCRYAFNISELRENLSGEKNTLKEKYFNSESSNVDRKEFQEDFKITLEEIADHFDIEK